MTIKAVVFDAYGTLYDVQSVADVTEQSFPGYGGIITQIWRLKQLEYTWLRSLMERYEDFAVVTRESLVFTLRSLDLPREPMVIDRLMDRYLRLDPYPDAKASLAALGGVQRAILSNGSPAMLKALVRASGLDAMLDATISVDARKVFKPSPLAYTLIERVLGTPPAEVLFVSSNPFDVCGAKSFGLNVAWIERVPEAMLARDLAQHDRIAPLTLFNVLRTQLDELGFTPDHRIRALSDLPAIVAA
ncbi:MAG: haloacid dehalogenase type II [Xanthobacteraceae bacterium]